MSFTRYIPLPPDIHLLLGLAIPPDLPLGHNLKFLGLPSQLEGMMALSSCLLKSIPLLAIDPVRINKKIFDRNEHERIL